ncbi:MAG: hypothetical protein V1679_02620 [Candidatus Peregrinibacteria bacterium]
MKKVTAIVLSILTLTLLTGCFSEKPAADESKSPQEKVTPITREEIQELEERAQKAYDSGDVANCSDSACELNILVNKAAAENNESICNQASTKSIQEECRYELKELLEMQTP